MHPEKPLLRRNIGGGARAERSEALLPCQYCNNSTEPSSESVAFPAAAARTAFALALNVASSVERWNLEQTGFLTLTFAEHVVEPREAQRRMNSLVTHVLRPRYSQAIRIFERQKSGRIHYHLLLPIGVDIRTGCDFEAFARRDYRSAPAALRLEWAFWRTTAKAYKFGRTELMPILSSASAVGAYVGKYIGKHLAVRDERDVGVRLVSYIGPRVATCKFAWAGGRGLDWRRGLGALVRDLASQGQIEWASVDAMRRAYGKRWAWHWRDQVRDRAVVAAAARGVFVVDGETGEIKGLGGSERPGGAVVSPLAAPS